MAWAVLPQFRNDPNIPDIIPQGQNTKPPRYFGIDLEGRNPSFSYLTGSTNASRFWGTGSNAMDYCIRSHVEYDPDGFVVTHHDGSTNRVYRIRAQGYVHIVGNLASEVQ